MNPLCMDIGDVVANQESIIDDYIVSVDGIKIPLLAIVHVCVPSCHVRVAEQIGMGYKVDESQLKIIAEYWQHLQDT